MAFERLVEALRGRGRDRDKARIVVADAASAAYREGVADYDAFVDASALVEEPSFIVGVAHDSTGNTVPIRLAVSDLAAHALVQGGTGTGKTSLVTGLVGWALAHDMPIAVADCKSGLFDSAIERAAAVAYGLDDESLSAFVRRLAVVHPFGEALPPLNVCRVPPGSSPEVQAYEVTLALSRLFDAALSVHMENILRHLLLLLTAAELSLVEAPAVLADEVVRGVLVERSGAPFLKDFFYRTYPTLPETSKHALAARLQALLLPEGLRLMLGADDLVDLRGVIARGDPMIAFLGKGPDAPEELVNVIGSLFLQLLFQAAYASGGAHRPYLIVLDEFFHLLGARALSDRFTTALTTLRSFGVHLCLVMHNFAQVSPALRETILGNCDLVALFRTSSRGAEFFGDFLPDVDPDLVANALRRGKALPTKPEMRRCQGERLQRLPNRQCFWYDRRQPHRALLVRVPDLDPASAAAGLTPSALRRFIAASGIERGGIAVPRDELRRQIADRQQRLRELIRPPVTISRPEEAAAEPGAAAPARRSRKPRLG